MCGYVLFTTFANLSTDGLCMPSRTYKSQVISNLCDSNWPSSLVCNLVTNFRDVSLTEDELSLVTNKFLEYANLTDPFSHNQNSQHCRNRGVTFYCLPIATIFSQSVLGAAFLLTFPQGQQDKILKGIVDHFNKLDRESRDETGYESIEFQLICRANLQQLRHIEGTIILHIDLAIKRDQVITGSFRTYSSVSW